VYNGLYCIEASAGIYKSTILGGQSSPRYIWQFTIRISTTTNYTLILPRSHSGSTANGETGEEAESRSQRAQIYSNKYPGLYIFSHYYKKESF